MTERIGRGSLAGGVVTSKAAKGDGQPLIPMNLFAAWDVDRTPPSCVPRLCSLTLSRLTVLRPLGSDITSITLAVKMQSSKRTLRSNEIMLPAGGGLLDTELELRFALQYPHYLKQWEAGNRLQVMLQRRKRYKNRTILGYKTLCSSTINMVAAVQRQIDMELELYGETSSCTSGKESVAPLARVQVQSLSSQPVDHEEAAERLKTLSLGDGAVTTAASLHSGSHLPLFDSLSRRCVVTTATSNNPSTVLSLSHPLVERGVGVGVGGGRSAFVTRYEDEDDDEFSSNEEGSDSDQTGGVAGGAGVGVVGAGVGDRRPARMNKAMLQNRGKIPSNARQRNLKQKFIALLKRFKITEDLQGLENEADEGCIDPTKLTGADLEMDAGDIEDLIDELEDLSDSGPEMDTLSVTSTPKPSLRPFFASSRSLLAPDPSLNPSAFTFPTGSSTFFPEKRVTSGGGGGGGRLLERHYSDESSKRADSDSTHAESMWTDQERESDTPTASSAHCPPHFATAHDDKTKNEKEVRKSRLFNRERSGPSLSSVSSGSAAPSPCSQQQQQQQPPPSSSSSLKDSKKSSSSNQSGGGGSVTPTSAKDKTNESSPRKILLEQLVRCMPADDALPDHVIMVSGADLQGCNLAGRLAERQQRAVCTGGVADVRATIACLVSKIQKFCNCTAKPPPPVKVVLMGPDSYVNSVLRCYVEQFSSKPPDWKNHLKFYIVPLVTSAMGGGSSSGGGGSSNNNSGNGIGTGGSNNTLARYLASLDRYYNVNFVSDSWREALDRPAEKMLIATNGNNAMECMASTPVTTPSKIDVQEVIHRLGRYLTSNGCTVQVPIAEAMITYREPNCEEESTQVFIPFVSEVRIGFAESAAAAAAAGSVDTEDGQQLGTATSACLSGSPPHQSALLTVNAAIQPGLLDRDQRDKERTRTTPPSSPNISSIHSVVGGSSGQRDVFSLGAESVELQVDYWLSGASAAAAAAAASATARESIASAAAISLATMAQAVKREKGPVDPSSSTKYTVKAGFRWIVVQRLPHSNLSSSSSSNDASSLFTMTFGLKEKKQKIMRLGKKKEKEKESESKSQVVEGINRLVCQAKTHHSLLKVVIDGVEWNNVKFFQLSSQWQTHIRHFPVALFTESVL